MYTVVTIRSALQEDDNNEMKPFIHHLERVTVSNPQVCPALSGVGGGRYLGGAGGPEWFNEPVHSLQNRCGTQGSQSSEHDEGQHLPRRKKTEFMVKWPRTKRSRGHGRSGALVPTLGAQVQTLALIPTRALPESLLLWASVSLSINYDWQWLPCLADLGRIR